MKESMNIILCGMMGCGKTTCAELLGRKLSLPVIDTDEKIIAMAGKSISEIFAEDGEAAFRGMETEVCRMLAQTKGAVIATGGGLPLREENCGILRPSGLVFFLNRSPEEIFDTADLSGRPLAQQGREDFLRRFREREPIYRAFAHYEITDFSSPENTAAAILRRMEETI